MPEIFLLKRTDGLFEPDPVYDEIAKKFGWGTALRAKTWKDRNYLYHKKFFAFIKYVYDNQQTRIYDNQEALRAEIIMRAGYFDTHVHIGGKTSFSPKSISFERMDNIQFEELFSKCIDVAIQKFCPDSSEQDIIDYVNEVIGFA